MIRNSINLFKKSTKLSVLRNNITKFGTKSTNTKPLLAIGATLVAGAAIGSGIYLKSQSSDSFFNSSFITLANAASVPKSQDSVFSQTKKHALYLTIHLKPDADIKHVLKVVGQMNKLVDTISPADIRDDENEILAGVGFSPNFLDKARPETKVPHAFGYHERKGKLGAMPSTGGDIFIHAKCDEYSKLFELSQSINSALQSEISKAEDVFGWVYRYGRDLSGFIDGTENAADEERRMNIAVNKNTGGSFVITQKWLHRHNVIRSEKPSNMENWVGRSREDSTEQRRKTASAHVARMTGGPNLNQPKVHEIVRQSQPFGTVTGDSGLFFIGYSANPEAFNYMLDRMVGADKDQLCDDIMRLSDCVTGSYWYFPGMEELKKIVA